jgi:hypothetical protein
LPLLLCHCSSTRRNCFTNTARHVVVGTGVYPNHPNGSHTPLIHASCRYWRVPRIIPTMLGSGTRSGPGWGRGVPRHRSRISLGRCVLPSRV